MASRKPASTSKPRKKPTSRSSNGSAPKTTSRAKPAARSKPTARSKASTSKSTAGSKSTSRSKPAAAQQNGSASVTNRVGEVAGNAKQVASKAKGPAMAVGAAAAGVAGGLLIKSRLTRPKVLGVPLPRALGKSSLDAKSIAKTVGEASQTFAKTTKSVSKDLERAGDQAERIGKILG